MKISELSGFDINKPVHAYLIAASGVSASREYSGLLAKSLLCENPGDDGEPCGRCPGCAKCDAGSHPDISVLGRARVSVKEIRNMTDSAYLSANEGMRKIFILEGMERFNSQSQNALLKTLEEPPKGVVFIVTTASKSAVLPTILSRCCVLTPKIYGYAYHEKNVRAALDSKTAEESIQIIASYLYSYEDADIESIDTEVIISAYRAAEDFFTGRDTDIIARFPKKKAVKDSEDTEEVISKAKAEAEKKEQNIKSRDSVGLFLRTLMLYMRNVAVYKQSGGKSAVRPANEDFRKICVRLSAKRAINLYEVFEKAYMLSESNANPNALYAFLSKSLN